MVILLLFSSGNEWAIGLLPYGQTWRDYRRALWQHFHPGAIVKYRPAQQAVTPLFLKKLLDEPEGFKHHIQLSVPLPQPSMHVWTRSRIIA